jgi:hypothetical protein
MGQGTQQSETNLERERTSERKKDESATGRDIPGGDGTVGDEQVDAIGGRHINRTTGQDHSTDHPETSDPDHGVGEFQDRENIESDIARIRD